MGHVRRDGRCWVLLLLIALVPSAWMAWQFADMPQLGTLHDDGLYVASAKSLAEGGEYRLASFPGQPWQTKYPPLYSMALAAAWRLGGGGTWALALMAWLSLAATGLLSWRWYLQTGLPAPSAGVMSSLFVLTPLVVFIGQHTLADILFTALVVASVLFSEKNRPVLGGILGGLAYLTRTAALPLLVTSPIVYFLGGKRRSAGTFAAAMLPFVLGWSVWSGGHRPANPDHVRMYYFDYIGFYLANVSAGELPSMIWANLWFWLTGVGTLLLNYDGVGLLRTLLVVSAVACLSGLRRHYSGGGWRSAHYLWFGGGFVALLLVWNFPPNERFSVPVYPLLLAGLAAEMRHVWTTFLTGWEKTRGANRAVAATGLAVLALVPACWLWFNGSTVLRGIPGALRAKRADAEQREPVYGWIRNHAEPAARFYAYDDPILYLKTGRPAMTFHAPTRFGYKDDQAAVTAELLRLPVKAREQNLDYVLLTADDFRREKGDPERTQIIGRLKATPGWTKMFEAQGAVLFRIKDPAGPAVAAAQQTP